MGCPVIVRYDGAFIERTESSGCIEYQLKSSDSSITPLEAVRPQLKDTSANGELIQQQEKVLLTADNRKYLNMCEVFLAQQ